MKYLPALLALLSLPALADSQVSTRDMFDRHGRPTRFGDEMTDKWGLPRLVEGVPYVFPDRPGFEGTPGCVTVSFLINADGHTDKFVVVDSQPSGVFDQAVLDSLKFWKFDVHAETGWASYTENFFFEPATGSRLGRKAAPDCASPQVTLAASAYPAKPLGELRPFYPPRLAQKKVQGCIVIGFSVIKGVADDYEVIDTVPEGEKGFLEGGLQALNRWHFEPGASPSARGFVEFAFGLKDAAAPPRACRTPQARGSK